MTNKEIKDIIQIWTSIFESYKYVNISFGTVSFDTKIIGIRKARTTGMLNKPIMRVADGKKYTPVCVEIECEDGILYFVIEDSTITQSLKGIIIEIGNTKCFIQSRILEKQ